MNCCIQHNLEFLVHRLSWSLVLNIKPHCFGLKFPKNSLSKHFSFQPTVSELRSKGCSVFQSRNYWSCERSRSSVSRVEFNSIWWVSTRLLAPRLISVSTASNSYDLARCHCCCFCCRSSVSRVEFNSIWWVSLRLLSCSDTHFWDWENICVKLL